MIVKMDADPDSKISLRKKNARYHRRKRGETEGKEEGKREKGRKGEKRERERRERGSEGKG